MVFNLLKHILPITSCQPNSYLHCSKLFVRKFFAANIKGNKKVKYAYLTVALIFFLFLTPPFLSAQDKTIQWDSLHEKIRKQLLNGHKMQADRLVHKALTAIESDDPKIAASLHKIGLLYHNWKKYDKAKLLYKHSLSIKEEVLGMEHLSVAVVINDLATVYCEEGMFNKAEPLFKRSLAIREKKLGKEHPDVADSLCNLAELYRDQGNYDLADPLFKLSLAIREKVFGKEHPQVATTLDNIAILYQLQKDEVQAEALFIQALEIRIKILGKKHLKVADSMMNLAKLYRKTNRHNESKILRKRAYRIYRINSEK
jgi:tetratricopeptide (TPR) repeat protein